MATDAGSGASVRPRLLFLSTVHPSPHFPATGRFNARLLDRLHEEWDVTAVVPVPGHRAWRRPSLPTPAPRYLLIAPRFWYLPRLAPGLQAGAMIRAVRRALDRQPRPDLVLSYWAYPDADAAGALAESWGVPSVAILGGSDLLLHARGRAHGRLIRRAIARQHRIYTIGEHLREAALAMGADPASTATLDRGIDRGTFSPAGAASRPGDGAGLVVWAGRMEPVKNLDLLLDAVAEPVLRTRPGGVRVVVIGDGSERRRLERRVRAEQLPIEFPGILDPHTLADWYRRADVVVLTSHSEGTPNVLLEAAATGAPFVTTAVGGATALAERVGGTAVPPGDAGALATALADHLDAPRGLWCPRAVVPDAGVAIGRLSGELAALLRRAR